MAEAAPHRIAGRRPGDAPVPVDAVSFGPLALDPAQSFLASPNAVAVVNLKPLAPGHVLVLPWSVRDAIVCSTSLQRVTDTTVFRVFEKLSRRLPRAEKMGL